MAPVAALTSSASPHGSPALQACRPSEARDGVPPAYAVADLARAAANERWHGPVTDALMGEIERRLVEPLPAHLLRGLGADEARQVARVVAWERLRDWAVQPGLDVPRMTWGYLGNLVRWRVADALSKETLRRNRHLATDEVPEPSSRYVDALDRHAGSDVLGARLRVLVDALEDLGMDRASATNAVLVACDDTDLRRHRMVHRIQRHTDLDRHRALALADLLLGSPAGAVDPVVGRLATGDPWSQVAADPAVQQRLARIATVEDTHAHPGGPPGAC